VTKLRPFDYALEWFVFFVVAAWCFIAFVVV
jgi:hypothetical protein